MKCPVCYEKELEKNYDICDICGWERDDFIPNEEFYVLDIEFGPNDSPSVDHARKAWKKWGTWGWFFADFSSSLACGTSPGPARFLRRVDTVLACGW